MLTIPRLPVPVAGSWAPLPKHCWCRRAAWGPGTGPLAGMPCWAVHAARLAPGGPGGSLPPLEGASGVKRSPSPSCLSLLQAVGTRCRHTLAAGCRPGHLALALWLACPAGRCTPRGGHASARGCPSRFCEGRLALGALTLPAPFLSCGQPGVGVDMVPVVPVCLCGCVVVLCVPRCCVAVCPLLYSPFPVSSVLNYLFFRQAAGCGCACGARGAPLLSSPARAALVLPLLY